MTFRRDSNTKKGRLLKYGVITVCIFSLWFLFESFIHNPLEKIAFASSSTNSFIANRLHSIYLYVAANSALYEENIRLNNELQAEKQRYIEVIELRDKVAHYERLTNLSSENSIFAKRIGFIDSLVHESFRINKGASEGIMTNQKVITQERVILGTVEEVWNSTSLISLLWDGKIFLGRLSSNGAVVSLKGTGSGVYTAEVPHDLDVKIDDVVLLDESPDLVVGVVKKINSNEEGLFKEVIIHTPIHPGMIDVVMVK